MVALPHSQPRTGAPRRSDQAPPLRAVPDQAPPAEAAEAPPAPAPEAAPETGAGPDRAEHLRIWVTENLCPPDLVNRSAPGLKTLWEQTQDARHLPTNPALRTAETVRVAVSLPLIGALVLVAWSLTSAPRTGALLVATGALGALVHTLISAAAELF